MQNNLIGEMSKNSENQILAEQDLWKRIPLSKMGPVTLKYNMSGIVGGRGFIASSDITPGTVLCREEPFIRLKAIKLEEMLIELFNRSDLSLILGPLGLLHPISLDHLEKKELESFRKEQDEMVSNVWKNINDKNQRLVDRDAILRLGLALRFNGFSSGIYLHLSIFNHQCKANCIKFAPEMGKTYSEVVAIEHIKKGTELTINYLTPFEQSTERRSEQLQNQFHFKCKCSLCVNDKFNKHNGVDILSLEKRLYIVDSLLKSGFYTKSLNSLMEYKDTYKLDANHLVLLRLNKMIVDTCATLLENDQGTTDHSIMYLKCSLDIYHTQIKLFPDHCDVARTCCDIANGIESLLNYDKQALYHHFEEAYDTKEKAVKSRKEFYSEFKRISAMYEEK